MPLRSTLHALLPLAPLALLAPPAAAGPQGPRPESGEAGDDQETREAQKEEEREEVGGREGGVRWFEGSFGELLETARESERLVLLDFWTRWCQVCKKLERETLSDPQLARRTSDILWFSVDAEAPKAAELVRRFRPRDYPTLLVLEPEGETRDVLTGFFSPEELASELERIRRGEGTLSALRAEVAESPLDVEARYALALKLRRIGDRDGYRRQIEAIRRLDPEGRAPVARRLRLDELCARAESQLRTDALYAFLEGEEDPELLFAGWKTVWETESHLGRIARDRKEKGEHWRRAVAASRALWPHAPERSQARALLANNIAWSFWEGREHLPPEDLRWALELAREAVGILPDDVRLVDTLACCLFANGQREEALRAVRRCIQLDPRNPEWRERLHDFSR